MLRGGFAEYFRCTALPRIDRISYDDITADDAKILRTRIDGFCNRHLRRGKLPGMRGNQ